MNQEAEIRKAKFLAAGEASKALGFTYSRG